MHAVINHLHLTKPIDDIHESLERDGVPLLAEMPGFEGFMLVKEAEDRAAALIFWDTQEHAINGASKFGPTWFATNIAPFLASEQQRSLGEVVVDART